MTDDHLNPIIQAIKAAREKQNLTQTKLAEIAGISRRAVSVIEGGADCTLGTVQRLMDALGLEAQVRPCRRMTLDDVVRESEEEMFGPSPGG